MLSANYHSISFSIIINWQKWNIRHLTGHIRTVRLFSRLHNVTLRKINIHINTIKVQINETFIKRCFFLFSVFISRVKHMSPRNNQCQSVSTIWLSNHMPPRWNFYTIRMHGPLYNPIEIHFGIIDRVNRLWPNTTPCLFLSQRNK